MVAPGTLLLRVEADSAIGAGHFMRCLALAQRWRDCGGKLVFATHCQIPALLKRAETEDAEIIVPQRADTPADEANHIAALAGRLSASWMVLDGYQFSSRYQEALAACGRLLLIDDHGHAGRYSVHLVLDQNITADPAMYSNHAPHTRLLLGTNYALLRREFRQPSPPKRSAGGATRLLITMGGADPSNAAGQVLLALLKLRGELHLRLLAGFANPHLDELRRLLAGFKKAELVMESENVIEQMRWADAAISAGGATCWELATTHTPMFLVIMAENHAATVRMLQEKRCAAGVGWLRDASSEQLAERLHEFLEQSSLRAELARNAATLTDGRGAERVVAAMIEASSQAAAP